MPLLISHKATCLMTITQFSSNDSLTPEFRSKKEIVWKNSLTYQPRLKKDLWSKFGLGPNIRKSRQTQSGIRAKIHSWSTIHCVSKICESARFTAKIRNLCAFEGQIRRSENLFTPLIKWRWLRWCFETKIRSPKCNNWLKSVISAPQTLPLRPCCFEFRSVDEGCISGYNPSSTMKFPDQRVHIYEYSRSDGNLNLHTRHDLKLHYSAHPFSS